MKRGFILMKDLVIYTVLVAVLGMMLFYGEKSYREASLYEELTVELVSHQGAEEQAKSQLGKFAKSILGGFYHDERAATLDAIREKQEAAMMKAKEYTIYFMILLVILLLGYFFTSLRAFTLFGSLAALLTLVLGLITPILMVTIHKEVEYIGDIVLSFESKGVVGSIQKLFESGDIVVALVIFLFSVLIPVLKVLSLLIVSLFLQSNFAHGIIKFFKMIGKWSMVDVFVVAVFLVYLTSNKGEISRAEVEVGLYFFLAYVIVSMLVSLSADKMLHKSKDEVR
ncbi:paraquat-inducible protein A [Sulfurovum sp.]|uniref:paraquat-inducible protein A n=1 Tax=Sulfurovum sp. TaxID=1969726 RepID=UPI002867BFCB|nr:paraquat-inducible protein A [Sulfurovum sp.]